LFVSQDITATISSYRRSDHETAPKIERITFRAKVAFVSRLGDINQEDSEPVAQSVETDRKEPRLKNL
jgi:hypothetical protein